MEDSKGSRIYDNGMLEGFVAREPELKYTPSGLAITRFPIPIQGRWDSSANERVDATVWVNVVAFGKVAETVAENVHKGMIVQVTGKFQANSWTDKSGNERVDLELIASKVAIVVNSISFNDDTPF